MFFPKSILQYIAHLHFRLISQYYLLNAVFKIMRISRKKNSCWLFYLAFQSLKPLSLDRFLLAPGKYQQGHDNFCESRECSLSEDGNKNISMATCHKKVVLTKIKLKVYCKVRWNYWLLVIGVTGKMSIKSPKRLL